MRRADGAASASNRRIPPAAGAAAAALLAALAWPSSGRAENKVYSPIVHYGEYSIEARGNTAIDRGDHATDEIENQKYELEYGVTDYWMTALVAEFNKNQGKSFHHDVTAWENILQLFPQGDAWINSAIYLEYEVGARNAADDNIESKLLLEKQFGNFVTTVNLIVEKTVGTHAAEEATFGYATRIKYRWKPYLEPGIEAYGDVGPISNNLPIDEQTHRIGPAVMGMFPLLPKLAFNYELGWLVGVTQGAPRSSLRWLGEIEYQF